MSFSGDHVLCATCVLWGAVDSLTRLQFVNNHDVSAVDLLLWKCWKGKPWQECEAGLSSNSTDTQGSLLRPRLPKDLFSQLGDSY